MAESRLKGFAGILVGAAALVTAIGAIFRPESKAEGAYAEVVPIILATQEAQRRDHEALVGIREYLASHPVAAPSPSPMPSGGGGMGGSGGAPAAASLPPRVAPAPPPRAPRDFAKL